mgnify:CR=1 FL=1
MECKLQENIDKAKELIELIDTLWNVNEVSSAVSKASSRINRYIMECKFDDLGSLTEEYIELIDTLWNVN